MNIISILSPNDMYQNTYLLTEKNTAILIDCGANLSSIAKEYEKHNNGQKLPNIDAIFLTHAHFDHILYLSELEKAYKPTIYIKKGCSNYISDPFYNLSELIEYKVQYEPKNIVEIEDETPIIIKDITISPLFTPGHSKCSTSYVVEGNIFTGDALFSSGYGRTDFIGGNDEEAIESVNKIRSLPCTLYYPGHGIPFK